MFSYIQKAYLNGNRIHTPTAIENQPQSLCFSFNTVQIGAQLPKTIKRGRGQQKIKHPVYNLCWRQIFRFHSRGTH